MRRDTCTTCGGAFKTDRDGLWSGDKREHRCESTCVKHLKERLAAAEAAARFYARYYDGPAEALLGEEDRKAFMWVDEQKAKGEAT